MLMMMMMLMMKKTFVRKKDRMNNEIFMAVFVFKSALKKLLLMRQNR
jgi:hypothetical protein